MIRQADTHDAAADNDDASLVVHAAIQPWMAASILTAFGGDWQYIVNEDVGNDFARFEGLRWENPLQTT